MLLSIIGYMKMNNPNIGYLVNRYGKCQKESATQMDKWHYIRLVSKASDAYGSELVKMMDKYDKDNLLQITLEEAEEYYKQLNENYYVF